VERAEAAGSLRRRRSTIGDLDFLAAAADAEPIMEAFCQHPAVARVLGHGPTKSSVEFGNGLQADLRVLPAERFGTLLQYFTGSKDHNVKIRELALRKKLSLNEHAFTRENGEEILCATEEEVYRRLGLDYIPPELREDRGEVEAAAKGTLPTLVTEDDLRSELHSHSTWSDGALTILAMAQAARAMGRQVLAVTDHSYSLGVTGGLTPERILAQRQEIDAAQKELGSSIRLLQGAEVEIKSTGQLDFTDEVLVALDIVVASLHTSLRQPREQITQRLLNAVQSRHVDIIGHPTGRLFPDREGADLDMEAILQAAAASGVALEINANPMRLDLDDVYAHRALQLGCLISINTDAHHASNLDLCHFGVGIARRAWATPEQVINTWPAEKLLEWLKARGDGLALRPATVTTAASAPTREAGAKKSAAKKTASKKAAATKGAAQKPARKTAAKTSRRKAG
jgi:DNA polymerase (family X)